jgi:hypothetical protein
MTETDPVAQYLVEPLLPIPTDLVGAAMAAYARRWTHDRRKSSRSHPQLMEIREHFVQ